LKAPLAAGSLDSFLLRAIVQRGVSAAPVRASAWQFGKCKSYRRGFLYYKYMPSLINAVTHQIAPEAMPRRVRLM
jgi:hypothetical protein